MERSGIDLGKLEPLIVKQFEDIRDLTGHCHAEALITLITDISEPIVSELRKSMASCRPTAAMRGNLISFGQRLEAAGVIDKPRLFIKASDLVDGISKVSLGPAMTVPSAGAGKDRDVVTRSALIPGKELRICFRCEGRSIRGPGPPVAPGQISLRWIAWQKLWYVRCICGGAWGLAT